MWILSPNALLSLNYKTFRIQRILIENELIIIKTIFGELRIEKRYLDEILSNISFIFEYNHYELMGRETIFTYKIH